MLASNLCDKLNLAHDEDFRGLMQLVKGLEHTAEFDLQARTHRIRWKPPLAGGLDNLPS